MKYSYEGWTLYDKVIIVEKIVYNYNYGLGKRIKTDEKQGYIVDPKNKKQLETAMSWAETKEYDYNPETKQNEIIKVNKGIIHEFQNEDFEIELLDSAEGSSQGGKLSFWNCKISKDDKSWIIGINADLLLKCLKSCTWVNGKCQDKVMFARCKGGVGVLSKNSPEYIKAQERIEKLYQDKQRWAQMCIANIGSSGYFTSDRTIEQYVEDVWHLSKVGN